MQDPVDRDVSLQGRAALVTGGTRGIGLAIARRLQRWGARVAVTSRQRETAEAVAASLPGGFGLGCDVAEATSVERAMAETVARFGRLDILVNNAGIAPKPGPIETTREEDWDRVIATDLKGPFLLCRAAVPQMKRGGWGRIVNIGSTGAAVTFTPILSYAAAKGGLVSFTKLLAMELAASAITVNAVLPGPVMTEMLEATLTQARAAEIARAIPLGRLGTPEEIAAAVAFLCSDAAAWITGEALTVGGGLPGRAIATG